MTTAEVWKDVVGYEDFYQVSNLGRVRSVDRTIYCADGKTRHFKGKLRSVYIGINGYPCVNLRRNSSSATKTVHTLIAEAFLGKRKNGLHVDHIDGNRANSVLDNLRYIPHHENEAQGAKKQGVKVAQLTMDGQEVNRFDSMAEAERLTGIKRSCICRACKGSYKQANGYIWRYA